VPAAFLAGEAGHGFVFHFEPFEAHDADEFFFLFPDLALAQFHAVLQVRRGHWPRGFLAKNLPLLFFLSRETAIANGYFFFAAADLAARAALFCALALLALDCFCEDFFWLDFGDLSPIILFFRGLNRPAEF
jgi:hypothetical protein